MKPDFSEFSYGYALTDNMRRSGLGEFTAAPVLPSLIAEGAAGGGYDLAVPIDGVPMLMQFKVPDVLTRRTARMPGGFETPYYRMHLRPSRHSDQHQLLLEHEAAGRSVFYACPRFHTNDVLNTHFLDDLVYFQSFLIKPSDVGELPDEDDHCVAYRAIGNGHVFQSQAKSLVGAFDSKHVETELQRSVPERVTRDEMEQQFAEVRDRTLSMVEQGRTGKKVANTVDRIRHVRPIRAAAYLVRVFLDCELFVVGRRE